MMKYILSFIIIITFISLQKAQKIDLQWDGSTLLDYGTEKKIVPHFKNDGFNYGSGNVSISLKQKTGGNAFEIKDLVWEKISETNLFGLQKSDFPKRDDATVSYYLDIKEGDYFANILITCFKEQNGSVFRLSSFSIMKKGTVSDILSTPLKRVGINESPLKSGNFYKIKVDKSGIFKITTKFLRDNGINPADINPKNFRVYGNGGLMLPEFNKDFRYNGLQENAIEVVGEDDGVWNDGDYALFYAQGPSGFNVYQSNVPKGNRRTETRVDGCRNFINIYDDFAYYFINFDTGPGKRVAEQDAEISGNLISRYDAYQFINEEKFNLSKLGRIWVGDAFTTAKSVTFSTNSPIRPEDVIIYKTNVIGYLASEDKIAFNINSKSPVSISVSKDSSFQSLEYIGNVTQIQGNQIQINYAPDITPNPAGQFFLDYAEVQYKEDLSFNDSQFNFRDYSINEGNGNIYSFSINNANSLEEVWEVSDITNPIRKVNKSGNSAQFNFAYIASSDIFNNEFVAFKKSAAFDPSFIGKIENQDLSSLQNIDYLIVTTPELLSNAERLAEYHRTVSNYNVYVADVNKIYNEFSSGGKDITAIRDFITKLNTPTGSLKYVFILGDSSFDFRGRMYPNTDIVPAYQSENSKDYSSSYITDDYFVITSPQTSPNIVNNIPDLPVGRLPAENLSEAKALIDKTLAYYNSLPGQSTPFGEWKMKLDFVADDDLPDYGASSSGVPFNTTVNDAVASIFETTNTDKPEYNVRKLYQDAFAAQVTSGGQRYPQVNQAITNDIGNSLVLLYFGHGGPNGWAQERVLTSDDIQNFNNFNNVYSRFPMVSTISCDFTIWDNPNLNSAGEQLMKLKTGGPATMIVSSRAMYTYGAIAYLKTFLKNIFKLQDDDFIGMGDAQLQAKRDFGANDNNLRVNYLGDPAMKLSRPKKLLTIDQIESPVAGQIRALDFVKISGHVNKADGTIDTSFNGRVGIHIFDKRLNKKTLNNDGDLLPVLSYTEEAAPIVKTSGTVVNGKYTAEFYVPKDINYTIGTGRILAYADNKKFDVFRNQPQQIGGINPDGISDNKPPVVNLYMNNTNFANGGITNANPSLLACITDDTGINSTGSGIGHDITVVLDGQIINTVTLNDFYYSGEGNGCTNPNLKDYQKGNVVYPFRNLSPGPHQLTFKVWDINNNSTTTTLNFVVKDEATENLVINKLLNWPNPFTDKTYIQFEHNCNDILDVNVQIYTLTGRLVRTLSAAVTAEPFFQGFRTPRTAIEWDGKDDFGDTVAKGVYIFKVFTKSENQEKCKGSAAGVEKMVLLK